MCSVYILKDMWKVVLVCAIGLLAVGVADDFISNGTWTAYSLHHCDNADEYPIVMDLQKRKINRTHDGFNLTIDLPYDITQEEFSIHAELSKKCDGGYKFQQNFDDVSFCGFINKYGQSNVERALTMANLDPPNCPLPKGLLEIKDFVVDYTELPSEAIVGDFKVLFYLIKGMDKVGCIRAEVGFIPTDDDDD